MFIRMTRRQVQIWRIAAGATLVVGFAAAMDAPARADLPPELAQDLVAYYPFDETSGTVVNDRSEKLKHAAIVNGNAATVWNGGRGLTLPGGNGGTAPAVALPDGLLSGLGEVTIAYDIRLSSATQQGPVFAFGSTTDNGGYLTATPGAGTTPHQASIAGPGNSPVAQTVGGPVALAAGTWKHVAVAVRGGDALTPGRLSLYVDGALVSSNPMLTLKPGDIASVSGFIGRSSSASGQQFRGTIKDFRIYAKELTASQVLALSNEARASWRSPSQTAASKCGGVLSCARR